MVIAPAIIGSVIGAIISSVLNITLPKVLGMIGKNSDIVESILRDLRRIEATIKDHPNICRDDGGHLLNQFIDDLRELAYDIQDCIEISMCQSPIDGTSKGKMESINAKELLKLKRRSENICAGFQSFNVTPASNSNKEPPPAAHLLTCMKNAEEKLLTLLEISATNKPKVITIAGFGGLGTNFLAKQFYDSKEGRQFSPRAWVNVAGENEAYKVHQKILASIIQQNGAATSTNDGDIQSIRKHLHKKRYLIVIEDAKTEELRDIVSAFSWGGGNDGGRIIVTTTIRSEKTWCICGEGSSLAVDNTAQFLKIGELTKSGSNFKEEDCAKFTKESRKVLDSNYQNLCSSVSLELPLLYFCMFPRDHPVRRGPLIRRWLAEGLISKDMQTAPDAAFTTLINSNIIQPIQISKNGKVKRCQTHAMMLDHISRMDEFKKFISLFCSMKPEASSGFRKFRRLSLHPNCKKQPTITNSGYDLAHVRTMAVFSSASPDCTFGEGYKLLRVLDLKEFADFKEKHFKDICNYLLLLKYLSLGENVGTVPKEINKLKLLETLDMRTTDIVTVPIEVIKLPSLTHLLGVFRLCEGDYKKVDKGLEKFLEEDSKLERLSGFVTHEGNGFMQLMQHMVSLRKVKVWCNSAVHKSGVSYHLKKGIEKFIDKGMPNCSDEYRISIDFHDCSPQFSENLMGPLKRNCQLTSLKLRGKLIQFPQFNAASANIIREVCLSYTRVSWDDILASLNNVKELKCLKLVETDLGHIAITSGDLKGLRRICLVGVQCLHNIDISREALPFLVSLHILSTDLQVRCPGIDIKRHELLEDIALHHEVDQGTKDRWQNYASYHPKRPKVLFIESGHSKDR